MRAPLLLLLAVGCAAPPASDDDSAVFDDDDSAGEEGTLWPEPCDAWLPAEASGTVEDRGLDEISGLVVSRTYPGVLWVHEDSGSPPALTALSVDGRTLATVAVEAANADWEDLALGPCEPGSAQDCLWIGEFGDNAETREDVALLRVPEPELDGGEGLQLSARPDRFPYRYPGGPQDAEALALASDGAPIVLTKREDGISRVHRLAPDALVPGELAIAELLVELAVTPEGGPTGLAAATTAADLWPDDSRLLVRGYFHTRQYVLEDGPGSARIDASEQVLTGLEIQGEAAAYDPHRRSIRHVAEGPAPTLWELRCAD